jgi:hypothetical protein
MQPVGTAAVPTKSREEGWGTTRMKISNALKSRSIVLVLFAGNVVLGLTTFVQSRTIQNQKQLIHILFRDSIELTTYKIAHVGGSIGKP